MKRANFARNFGGKKRADGGFLDGGDGDEVIEPKQDWFMRDMSGVVREEYPRMMVM